MSRFPFPRYPNGWFQVAYTDDLPAGAVVPLSYFGKELVAFRGGDGAVNVLDAHCPHLGAHLGYGGKVEGNRIRCPFHAWQFDGSGACTHVPYSDRAPQRAQIRSWHCVEKNGLILVWYHALGAPPAWDIPDNPEYGVDGWTAYEKRRWRIRTHNQEMAENAVDSAHFHYVHGTVEIPKSEAWADGPILRVLSSTVMRTPMGRTTGSVESVSYGFGYSLTRFKGIVETLLIGGITPIDDEYVDVRFSFTLKKCEFPHVTSTVGQAFIAEVERQLEQDIPIWEHKAYVSPPRIVVNDGPIGLFRRWVKQFYSESEAAEGGGSANAS